MAGFDPSIFTNKDTGILNDPAVLLQTLGAITPGISRGTTRLRPGIALNALGQAYGDVRQQNMLQQLTSRFTEPYRQPFQMLPSAERAETEIETEQPTPEERFKAVLKPPPNFAQILGTLSPQESRAFVRSMGPQGFGLAGLGQTGTLENIWKTAYGQAVDERQMKLSQLTGEALNMLRGDPMNEQARQMLAKAMPLLRQENQGIVQNQLKDIESRAGNIAIAKSFGMPAEFVDAPAFSHLAAVYQQRQFEQQDAEKMWKGMVEAGIVTPEQQKVMDFYIKNKIPMSRTLMEQMLGNAQFAEAGRALNSDPRYKDLMATIYVGGDVSKYGQLIAQARNDYPLYAEQLQKDVDKAIQLFEMKERIRYYHEDRLLRSQDMEYRIQQGAHDRAQSAQIIAENRFKTMMDPTSPEVIRELKPGWTTDRWMKEGKPTTAFNDGYRDQVERQQRLVRSLDQEREQAGRVLDLRYNPDLYIRGTARDFGFEMERILADRATPIDGKKKAIQALLESFLAREEIKNPAQYPKAAPLIPQLVDQLNKMASDGIARAAVAPPAPGPTKAPSTPTTLPTPGPTPSYLEPGSIPDILRQRILYPSHQVPEEAASLPGF